MKTFFTGLEFMFIYLIVSDRAAVATVTVCFHQCVKVIIIIIIILKVTFLNWRCVVNIFENHSENDLKHTSHSWIFCLITTVFNIVFNENYGSA